ncbi:hypothetical protein [Nocardia brasiliensis]|uniref:hypothetical protein n=1 Tax=Nocardia brasiliensis TaxID=37326 RepID=UPI0024566510|nr:hypothetical protein [Nocardia brasiliensis]
MNISVETALIGRSPQSIAALTNSRSSGQSARRAQRGELLRTGHLQSLDPQAPVRGLRERRQFAAGAAGGGDHLPAAADELGGEDEAQAAGGADDEGVRGGVGHVHSLAIWQFV